MYNWQNQNWPEFFYKLNEETEKKLYLYGQESSRLTALAKNLSTDEALLELMVIEAQKTSEIEGELIEIEDIRSSLKKQLGIPFEEVKSSDKRAERISHLVVDVRNTFKDELTEDILFRWHRNLMQDLDPNFIGCYRSLSEPMQIVSGPIGREKVFFEAPPSERVPFEMRKFMEWFNKSHNLPGPIRASIGHLYFESIHPFIDGNGRIGRAIVEKILSQDLDQPVLFSLSNTLMENRKRYYNELHENSRDSLDISSWICFFIDMIYQSQMNAKKQILFVIQKSLFWQKFEYQLNSRQKIIIQRMMKEGINGFLGGMSAKKYMSITDCSKATATRDLTDLFIKKCFIKICNQGPNTRYDINLEQL